MNIDKKERDKYAAEMRTEVTVGRGERHASLTGSFLDH